MSIAGRDLLAGPPPTLLPDEPEPRRLRERGSDPAEVARRFPSYAATWADLADQAYAGGEVIASYAYARTGYHRGLDALRRAGWKGFGQVPWSHPANRGWLRAVHALARAAEAIGEDAEAARCQQLLDESDPTARAAVHAGET